MARRALRNLCQISAALAVLTSEGCVSDARFKAAEQAASKLHVLLDRKAFGEVYAGNGHTLRQNNRPEDFAALLKSIDQTAGDCRAPKLESKNFWFLPRAEVIELTFRRSCTTRSLREVAQFEASGEVWRLSASNFTVLPVRLLCESTAERMTLSTVRRDYS